MADRINFKELECGDLVRIILYQSDIVAYVWNNDNLEREFGLKGKIEGFDDGERIFSALNPMGTTNDRFVDNVQFFGTSYEGHYLKVSTIKGKAIKFDNVMLSVHGYELIKKHFLFYASGV